MNKRLVGVLIAFVLATIANARTIFTPDGTLLYRSTGDTFTSVAAAMREHFPGMPYHSHIAFDSEVDGSVTFKLLTNEPLLIFIEDARPTEEQRLNIHELIESFDYEDYLYGWELAFDLKMYGIELGLGDLYVLSALGPPSSYAERTSAAGSLSLISYRQYGLVLTFLNGRLTEVLEIR